MEQNLLRRRAVVVVDPVEVAPGLPDVASAVGHELVSARLGGLLAEQALCSTAVEASIDHDRGNDLAHGHRLRSAPLRRCLLVGG